MKFAIAAGILAQTLPVVADSSAGLLADAKANAKQLKLQLQDALLQDHAGQQDPDQPSLRLQAIKASRTKKRKKRFPADELKNNPGDVVFSSTPDLAFEMEYCDPASEDPDVGVLSCGIGHVCKASQKSLLGGVCAERTTKKKSPGGKNKAKKEGKSHLSFKTLKDRAASFSARPSVADAKACDPESDDPDVGVLSCGPDSFCESRPASVLGGLCVAPGPSSRALQAAQIYCAPDSPILGCDCSGYDISTGTGDVVCEYRRCLDTIESGLCSDRCCIDTCSNIAIEINVVNGNLTSLQDCYDYTDPYPQEFCQRLTVPDSPDGLMGCSTTFDGQDCLCEVTFTPFLVELFDCSAVGGPVANEMFDTPPAFLLPIVESCYEFVPPCHLCDSYIPDENYNITVGDGITCGDIAGAVYVFQTLREDNAICPAYQELAAAYCCVNLCEVCNIPYENDNITVGDGITCFDIFQAVNGFGFGIPAFGFGIPALREANATCPAYQELAAAYCCSDGNPPCELCGATGYMDPALFSSTVSIPTVGEYTCGGLASAAYEMNALDAVSCSGLQMIVPDLCCSDAPGVGSTIPTGAPGSGSAIPTGAPGSDTSMSPTSPSPVMIDPAGPTPDPPDGANGGLSKQAVASFLGTTTALALLFLS